MNTITLREEMESVFGLRMIKALRVTLCVFNRPIEMLDRF